MVPDIHLQIRPLNDGEERLILGSVDATALARLFEHGLAIPSETLIANASLVFQRDGDGRRTRRELARVAQRLVPALAEEFDFRAGSAVAKAPAEIMLTDVIEKAGVGASIAVADAVWGTHDADWERIPPWDAANDAGRLANAIAGQFFADEAGSVDLGSIVDIIDPNPTHRYPAYVDDGVPLISTVNFDGPDGIDITNAPRVPDWFFEQTVERLGVTVGDVIFARKGRIGCARAYPEGQRFAMTHTLCVIRPDRARLHPAYLLQYLRSPFLLRFLQATMNPNSGVPTLGLNVIRRAPIQLPSHREQEVIAARIGAATQQIAAVIESMKAAQDERHRLESALVSAAFSGRL